jgi:hypothetical protein
MEWIRAKSSSSLMVQENGEYLMLVRETADGALKSVGEGKGVSFHTFSVPEDRCVRLLLKET